MKRKFFICFITALTATLAACANDTKSNNYGHQSTCSGDIPEGKVECICIDGQWGQCRDILCEGDNCDEPGNEQNPQASEIVRSLDSKIGCSLDTDCAEGAFCFQNQCVIQCSQDKSLKLNCASGYYCDATRGRCVTQKAYEHLGIPWFGQGRLEL